MNKTILILALLFVLPFASSATIGSFGQNQCVDLIQTCDNCTYVNITKISAKTNEGASVVLLNNPTEMTNNGVDYNYTFCATGYIGEYTYITVGDPDGYTANESVTFSVGVDSIILYVIIFVLIFGVSFTGFFGKHIWVSLLGGLALLALGIFTISNGIAGYRIFITDVVSITTIGIGAIFAITAGIELIKDTYGG